MTDMKEACYQCDKGYKLDDAKNNGHPGFCSMGCKRFYDCEESWDNAAADESFWVE